MIRGAWGLILALGAAGGERSVVVTVVGGRGRWSPLSLGARGWGVGVVEDSTAVWSGVCPEGFFCGGGCEWPAACAAGGYCPSGSSSVTPCPPPLTSLASGGSIGACSLRVVRVSVTRIRLSRAVLWPAGWGVVTRWEATVSELGGCEGGTYCPTGAVAPMQCPAWSYCPALSKAAIACGKGLMSAAGSESASQCDTRWFNVTLGGVDRGRAWTAGLPAGWAARERELPIGARVEPCPAGRYCPAGSSAPVVCDAGAYSGATGQWSAEVCASRCAAGSYCPDPGQQYPCPNHTVSPAGSPSQLGCACKKGLVCLYGRQLQVSVLLRVSLGEWLSDASLRASLVQVVAFAAGVDRGRVWVTRATPQSGSSSGARRLLGQAHGDTTLVHAAVHNGEAVHGLRERLGEAHPRLRDARVHWTPGSRVRVLGGAAFPKSGVYI